MTQAYLEKEFRVLPKLVEPKTFRLVLGILCHSGFAVRDSWKILGNKLSAIDTRYFYAMI